MKAPWLVWLSASVVMSAASAWSHDNGDDALVFSVVLGSPPEAPVECTDWWSSAYTTAGRLRGFFAPGGLTSEVVEECLRRGADPNAVDDSHTGKSVLGPVTPLMQAAAFSGDPAVIDALLEAGARLVPLVLHAAAGNPNMPIIRRLIGAGAHVDARDGHGATPLALFAAWSPNPASVRMLVEAGGDPNARSEDGRTPLSYAASHNHNPAVVTALVEAGGDLNLPDERGLSPLHWGARSTTKPEVVRALLKAGASPGGTDSTGRTAMHWAQGNRESPKSAAAVVAMLAEAGADPNAVDREGRTPLHLAARWEADPRVIDALVAAGGYVDLPDDAGKTAIDWAADSGNPAVLAAVRGTGSAHPAGGATIGLEH